MQKTIFISIVSHKNEDLIIENFIHFPKKIKEFRVVITILDNSNSKELKSSCLKNNIGYILNERQRGFGANHNRLFKKVNPRSEDIYIICNPDISIKPQELYGLVKNFSSDIGSARSYLNKNKNLLDFPDRYFPYFINFIISIILRKRLHYGSNLNQQSPEWISGSFMIFKPDVFRALNGFDEGYFMYCEDIDICLRAKKKNFDIKLNHAYYIEHNARMASRKLFSKHIIWHIKSAFRFSIKHDKIFGLTMANKKNPIQI